MLSTASSDPQQLLEFLRTAQTSTSPDGKLAAANGVPFIGLTMAVSSTFEENDQPATVLTWNTAQRRLQRDSLLVVRRAIASGDVLCTPHGTIDTVVLPRLFNLATNVQRWIGLELDADDSVSPHTLYELAVDTIVMLLRRLGEEHSVSSDQPGKNLRGWETLRKHADNLVALLRELRTLPVLSYPLYLNIVSTPHILDHASQEPNTVAGQPETTLITLRNARQLLLFAVDVLFALSSAFQPTMSSGGFLLGQLKATADEANAFTELLLAMPIDERQVRILCRMAHALSLLSLHSTSAQTVTRAAAMLLAARARVGPSVALGELDRALLAMVSIKDAVPNRMISLLAVDALRTEDWVQFDSAEASALRDVLCAAAAQALSSLDAIRLQELTKLIELLPESDTKERLVGALLASVPTGSNLGSTDKEVDIPRCLTLMGVTMDLDDVNDPGRCLGVVSAAARNVHSPVELGNYMDGLVQLPKALQAAVQGERALSIVPTYFKIFRELLPSLAPNARHKLYSALVHAASVDTGVWNKQTVEDLETLLNDALILQSRTVRVAAGILLATALGRGAQNPSLALDRETFCNIPATLLLSQTPHAVRETAILALGAVGKMGDEPACRIAIFALVKELAHSSMLLRGLAHLQLRGIAAHKKKTFYSLVSPYLADLACFAASTLIISPVPLHELCRLLGLTPRDFFLQTLQHTLPSFTVQQQDIVLARIAEQVGSNVTTLLVKNAAAVLAQTFLSKDSEKIFAFVQHEVEKGSGKKVEAQSIVHSCLLLLVCELVSLLGDTELLEGREAVHALEKVQRVAASAVTTRSARTIHISKFLQPHLLGIVTHLSELLHDVRGKKSMQDKILVLKSLGSFVKIVGEAIHPVAQQVMAMLQSVMFIDDLSEAAVKAWNKFVHALAPRDLGPHVGPISAILVTSWYQLSPDAQKSATQTLEFCIIDNKHAVRQHLGKVVDLEGIPQLARASRTLAAIRQTWTRQEYLDGLLRRCTGGNIAMTRQSLLELKKYITARDYEFLNSVAAGDVFDPVIARIIDALVSATLFDGEDAESIHLLAFEILGIVGALDPDRFDSQPRDALFVMIHNFEDQDEGFKFACHLIQELLVPAFRSTGDPRFQTSVGYALQELSKYCGFVAEVDSLSVHNVVRARWDGLSQAAQETTTPFLGAKFVVQTKPQADISLPIYPSQSSYREWLQTWVAHLITRVSSEPARLVFSACRGAVRGNDARVALHLLPHLVLHVLIGGTEDDCSWIRAEIVAVLEDVVDRSSESRKDRRVFSAQTTFSLLDHLNTWVRCARQHEARAETRKQRRSTTSTALKNRIVAVDSVLSAIDRDLMAKAAFQCQAYARALMNLEQQVTDRRDAGLTTDSWLRDYYERMHEIYSLVDEPDGMEGIATLIVSPSMEMQIRQHESTGKWTAAQSCWEVKLQRAPDELNLHLGLLRCLRNLGHYDTLRTHIQGILTRNPDWRDHLVSLQLESAWIVGAWDEVERGLSSAPAHLPETAVSRMLLSVRSKDEPSIQAAFAAARLELGAPISTSNRGSYRQSYNALMGLHAVHELQLVHGSSSTAHLLEVTSPTGQELQRRFDSLLPTFRIQETALNMRRTFLELRIARESRGTVATDSPSMQTIGQTWLLTAKIARKAGHHQTAYSAILQAQQHQTSFAFVQNCKLVKENGETLRALEELTAELNRLQDVVERRTSDDAGVSLNDYDRRQLSKAMVLRARWMPETARFGYNDISKQFTAAIALCGQSESAYFHYGFYQDDYFKSLAGSADAWSWNIRTVQNYAKSLEYGSKYIYQTMPRMLTLWLDHAEDPTIVTECNAVSTDPPTQTENMKAYHKMHGAMQLAQHRIAVYKWLTAFPQIVSRVDHKNDMAFKVLNTIMRNVITGYPHQGLWAFMSVWNSNHTLRRKRGDSLLRNMMNRDAEMKQLIAVSSSMAKELLKLCDLDVQAIPNPSLKSHIPGLAKLMTTSPKLILPFQDSLTPTMPPRGLDGASHQPFPPDLPTIIGFEDEVEVMKSLAKPRRLTIIASNGQRYMMMAKPKDDLRKDARLMDFNTIINKLLKKNSDSRRRQLHIRTYSVITLNEECGLIQWVPNVMPVRHILEKLYKAQGKQIYPPDVLLLYGRLKDLVNMSDVDAIDAFKVKLLDAYKPVLHEWFIDTFPDPSAWLASRLAFSRTCAVMSIIGAMLGLGDRHSENILLDTVSGDLIHVDFNCLFDKGKLLEQAEKVPFRLTHNIVDALGVTGVEGVFRTTCEIVMELLRDYNDCLMNVLDAFVHDPLVEWEDEKKRRDRMAHRQRQGQAQHLRSSSVMEEDVKRVAKQAMENIAMRLSGRLPPNQTIISPADQVAALISAASAPVNLCRMFYGWAPHL